MEAAEQPVLIDVEQAQRMLDVLGLPRDEPVILSRWWKDGDRLNMNHYPRKNAGDGYDWAALQVERFYEAVAAEFRPGIDSFGFVPERGGIAYDKRKEITEVRFLKYEIDDASMSLEEQFETWRRAGLPPPTLVLFTGGKSLHFWWRLKTPLPLDEGIVALKRLQEAIRQATPGVKLDPKMESPAQPMRLAGGIHPGTRQRSTIYAADGRWYEASEILSLCPEITVKARAAKDDGGLFRAEEGKPAKPGEYPEPDELTLPIPLRLGLSRATYERIHRGDKEGVRAKSAYDIARSLQESKAMIEFLGYRVEEDPIELFEVYCRNSDWCGYEGFDFCVERHFAGPDEVGTGQLSKSALERSIATWAEETGQWRWKPTWSPGRGFASQKTADVSRDRTGPKDRKHLPLHSRLDLFERFLRRSLRRHRNPFRRMVFLRAVVKQLDLGQVVKEKDLPERVVAAMSQRMGGRYQALTAEQRRALQLSEVVWLVPGVIPAGDLTFVGGRPKVGKTLLVVDLIRCLLNGEGWLGFPSTGVKHAVIFVTDDQGDRDTKAMLTRQGLWDHERLLWSSSFRLDEQQLDQLLDDIKANPGAVVVVDSLRSISRGLTTNENDAALGVLLYDLKSAVMAAGGSLLMIHHASKTSNEVGVEALSGHSSIPGAGNSVVTLHYLPAKDGKSVQKDIPERRLFREGRSGSETPDLVVRIGPAGQFTRIQTYEDFLGKQEEVSRSKRLSDQSQLVQDALCKLLERRDQRLPAIGTLELLRLAGGCDESVRIKADLGNDSKHKHLERRLKAFEKEGCPPTMKLAGRRQARWPVG
ncbi:AAA family ATPase [Synechococcus sp. CBW1108]|uniref:AAA family ATPase n=1 Tax=Synechococcus sp. CBW1108 TaxID=1353147 RepID=UPI0018CEFED8|nr:AAA family ATPase [Synechococcus sp. CBW1108]QPN70129.1 AAA family ATPase [Synechococcus sp. CBW1108]